MYAFFLLENLEPVFFPTLPLFVEGRKDMSLQLIFPGNYSLALVNKNRR